MKETMKKIIITLILFVSISTSSQQKEINNYKYIIVANKFNFLKSEDQYQTSSLTRFLLKKKGFIVFKSDENFPNDLSENRCLALTANVIDASRMFSVKSKIELRDCNNLLVYTSKEVTEQGVVYQRYSGHPSDKELFSIDGKKIDNFSVPMNSLEAGEVAYAERSGGYESIKN